MTTTEKEIYIRLKDGDKESELKINHIDDNHKLSLIDGFFQFFDVDVNFKELAETYLKVGKSYKEFYGNSDISEFAETNESIKTEPIAEPEAEETVSEATSITNIPKQVIEHSTEVDYTKTGIREKQGINHYRCHYKCPNCKNRGNHYIPMNHRMVSCHDCKYQMLVRPATDQGFPETDIFGNFYIAGDFQTINNKKENDDYGRS